jgi:hypothetical protein
MIVFFFFFFCYLNNEITLYPLRQKFKTLKLSHFPCIRIVFALGHGVFLFIEMARGS